MTKHKKKLKRQQQRERGRAKAKALVEQIKRDVKVLLAPAVLAAGLEDAASAGSAKK